MKENRSDCRLAVSGAVQRYRSEQKVVSRAILFKLFSHFIIFETTSVKDEPIIS